MLKLYIANKNYSSWSLRPWVLMRELNIAFAEILVPFDADPSVGSFRKFSPSGKVPCLVDGARVVWDSLAIAEYLAERTGEVWPADVDARAFARCAAAEMHSGFFALRVDCTMSCGLRINPKPFSPALSADLQRIDQLWKQGLERFGGPFLAGGEFTAADAFFAPVAFRVQTYTLPLSDVAQAYVERLLALPAMREWYAAALAEPWRDATHEKEARGLGTLLHDHRTGAA
ncbi:MAG: glutathione S-transferase family protein [Propionivibrio sp.]